MSNLQHSIAITTLCLLVAAPQLAAGNARTQSVGGCAIFPANNIWNARVDVLPIHPQSSAYINSNGGPGTPLHPDFGTVYNGAPNGILFIVVPTNQPLVQITLQPYGDQADPGPYPVPTNAPVEGGIGSNGDRHVLIVRQGDCQLFELYRAFPKSNGSWAGFGAAFDLKRNGPLRPGTYTSADAAGLPILPGLVKYDEVLAAANANSSNGVGHAIRFTIPNSQRAYVWPARHFASSSTDADLPPMGQYFRLKASVNIDVYPGSSTPVSPMNKAILRTLKTHGMIVADNGSSFYINGAPDARWDDDDLNNLAAFTAGDFEAIEVSSLIVDPNSGEARARGPTTTPGPSPTVGPTPIPSATPILDQRLYLPVLKR